MGLILRPPLVGAIKQREKTQVLLRLSQHPRCPYKVGNSYAVQSIKHHDGVPSISEEKCRIHVVGVWRSNLDQLTDEDAQQEGFPDFDALVEWWRERYHEGPLMDVPLHVVRFELDHTERPRFLAKVGYTHSAAMAIPDSEEAIDEGRQEHYAREANQTALLEGGRREEERRENWNRTQRLRRIEALSKLTGVDVSSDLRIIDRRLAAAEKKLGRRAA